MWCLIETCLSFEVGLFSADPPNEISSLASLGPCNKKKSCIMNASDAMLN